MYAVIILAYHSVDNHNVAMVKIYKIYVTKSQKKVPNQTFLFHYM